MIEKLTREETIRRHRELWNKIAEMQKNSEDIISKHDALEELGYTEKPLNDCWCCEYVKQSSIGECMSCPVKWPRINCSLLYAPDCSTSWFSLWNIALLGGDLKAAVTYARCIADLPEKENAT